MSIGNRWVDDPVSFFGMRDDCISLAIDSDVHPCVGKSMKPFHDLSAEDDTIWRFITHGISKRA